MDEFLKEYLARSEDEIRFTRIMANVTCARRGAAFLYPEYGREANELIRQGKVMAVTHVVVGVITVMVTFFATAEFLGVFLHLWVAAIIVGTLAAMVMSAVANLVVETLEGKAIRRRFGVED